MLSNLLDRLEETIIAALMGAATVVIFLAVVHRYGSTLPVRWIQDLLIPLNMGWAQELCIYMFVWMAKFGAAYGVRTGIHVGVDVLVNQLPPKGRFTSILLGLFAGALFTGIVAFFGASFVWDLAHTDQTSPDMELPMWIVYLAIPCGSYLMSFRFIQVAWTFARTGDLPHHDAAHVEGVDMAASPNVTPQPIGAAR